MKKRIVVAMYLRLSKEDEVLKDESNSIGSQRFLIKKYILKHFDEYSVELREFRDDGYSGTNFDRPGIKELLEEVKKSGINVIIVKDFSRFSRDYIELGSYMEQIFPFLGIRFISVNDHYDSENYKGTVAELDTNFRSLLYDLYSKDLSVKVKSSLEIKKEKGLYISSQFPFGYKKDEEDCHKPVIKEEEAEVVRRIFDFAMQGMNSTQIARIFNAEKVKTPVQFKLDSGENIKVPKAKQLIWDGTYVYSILHNPFYAGDVVYDKFERKEVGGKPCRKPISEWKVYRDHHTPIIDRETFDALQKPKRKCERAVGREKHPLVGAVRCGCCGKSLTLRKNVRNPYFECEKRYSTGYEDCVKEINVMFLEQLVLYMLQQEMVRMGDYQKMKESYIEKIKGKCDYVVCQKQQLITASKDLENARKTYYEKYVFSGRKAEYYLEQINDIAAQKKALESQIETLQQKEIEYQEKMISSENDVEKLLHYAGFTTVTGELIDSFVEEIVVYDEKRVEIAWKFKLPYFVVK